MTKPTRKVSTLRPHSGLGHWLSDDRRYCEYARTLLVELERVTEEVKKQWPGPLDQALKGDQHTPELWSLVRKRDLLSDSVKIFSAMAVEAFLNYYGIVRLGEDEYASHFERLGLVPKLRTLLLVCDSLLISEADPLVQLLQSIARRRNSLVHPKAQELEQYVPAETRGGNKIPEVARDAVQEMDAFFKEFFAAVPKAVHLVPQAPTSSTSSAASEALGSQGQDG